MIQIIDNNIMCEYSSQAILIIWLTYTSIKNLVQNINDSHLIKARKSYNFS